MMVDRIILQMDEVDLVHSYLSETTSCSVMVDVGAHHGESAQRFLKSGWDVWAFEPDPDNRIHLRALVAQEPRLTVDPRAVTDRVEKEVPFFTSPVSSGISSLERFHESHVNTTRVDTTTLNAFCQERGIHEVGFLKIDAEGYDLPVLRGVPWSRFRPAVILSEFEDRKTVSLGYKLQDQAAFLQERGYTLVISEWYPVVAYGQSHRWRRFCAYPCESIDPAAWGNVLAFRDAPDWPRLLTACAESMKSNVTPPSGSHATDVEIGDLERQVQYLTHSVSWRLTAPLRAGLRVLKAVARKGR